jgi:hypothetical protein
MISPPMLGLLMLLLLFVLMSGLYGGAFGKFDIWGKEPMPSFFAVRPMATSQYVSIKMAAAAFAGFLGWCWLLVILLAWAAVEASPLNVNQSIVRRVIEDATAKHVALFVLALVGLLGLSCRDLVTGMWTTLLGNKWYAMAIGAAWMVSFGLSGFAGYWLYNHRDVLPRLLLYAPWLLGVLLFIKLGVAAWIVRELTSHQLVTTSMVHKYLRIWVVAYVGLLFVVWCFTPLTATAVLGTAIALPMTRIAAAPLCLHWNRHR